MSSAASSADPAAAAAAAAAAAQQAAAAAMLQFTIEAWTLLSIGLVVTMLRTYARIKAVVNVRTCSTSADTRRQHAYIPSDLFQHSALLILLQISSRCST